MDLNRVVLSGRLLEKPFYTVRSTGKPITILNVAVHESETRFEHIKVIAFDEDAEVVRDGLDEHDRVLIEGRLVAVDRGKKGAEVYADSVSKVSREGRFVSVL